MKTITITPVNEEVIPFLTELLSNKKLVSDIKINSGKEHIPNKKTLQAIKDAE